MGSVVNKVTKPIARVLDKIVPNEIKPILPFAAAIAAPYLGSTLGGLGGLVQNATLRGAIGGGLLNLAGQLPQEGYERRGVNLTSLGLASLAGGIGGAAGAAQGTPGGIDSLRAGMTVGTGGTLPEGFTGLTGQPITAGDFANFQALNPGVESVGNIGYSTDLSALQSAENLIRSGAASLAETAKPGLEAGKRIFTGQGSLKDIVPAAQTLGPSIIGAATESADRFARDALDEYNRQQAALGQTVAQNKADQIFYIRQAMQQAGFDEGEIVNAISKFGFADGGRVGYAKGGGITRIKFGSGGPGMGSPRAYESFKDFLEQINVSYPELDIINIYDNNPSDAIKILEGMGLISQGKKDTGPTYAAASPVNAAKGGLMNLRMGGMPVEMDFRAKGGFVPIGKKERADDVPARLSKNEFVFTAKAVRNAGGGDIRKGAKRMYQLMNQLEARA